MNIRCLCDSDIFTLHANGTEFDNKQIIAECSKCGYRYTVHDGQLWVKAYDYETGYYRTWHTLPEHVDECKR